MKRCWGSVAAVLTPVSGVRRVRGQGLGVGCALVLSGSALHPNCHSGRALVLSGRFERRSDKRDAVGVATTHVFMAWRRHGGRLGAGPIPQPACSRV
eukprot:366493-Chlamydomonas_euryale.AAC.3